MARVTPIRTKCCAFLSWPLHPIPVYWRPQLVHAPAHSRGSLSIHHFVFLSVARALRDSTNQKRGTVLPQWRPVGNNRRRQIMMWVFLAASTQRLGTCGCSYLYIGSPPTSHSQSYMVGFPEGVKLSFVYFFFYFKTWRTTKGSAFSYINARFWWRGNVLINRFRKHHTVVRSVFVFNQYFGTCEIFRLKFEGVACVLWDFVTKIDQFFTPWAVFLLNTATHWLHQ